MRVPLNGQVRFRHADSGAFIRLCFAIDVFVGGLGLVLLGLAESEIGRLAAGV